MDIIVMDLDIIVMDLDIIVIIANKYLCMQLHSFAYQCTIIARVIDIY